MKYPYISQEELGLYSGCGLVNLAISLSIGTNFQFKTKVDRFCGKFTDFLGKERSYAKDLEVCASLFSSSSIEIIEHPLKCTYKDGDDYSLIFPIKVKGSRWYRHWISVHSISGSLYVYDPLEVTAKKFEKIVELRELLKHDHYLLPDVRDGFYKKALVVKNSL